MVTSPWEIGAGGIIFLDRLSWESSCWIGNGGFYLIFYPMYQRDESLRNCGKVSLRVSNRCSIREKEVLCFCGCINERIIFTDHFHDEETISLFFLLSVFFHWIRFVMISEWSVNPPQLRRHSKPLDDARCFGTLCSGVSEFQWIHPQFDFLGEKSKMLGPIMSRCFLNEKPLTSVNYMHIILQNMGWHIYI